MLFQACQCVGWIGDGIGVGGTGLGRRAQAKPLHFASVPQGLSSLFKWYPQFSLPTWSHGGNCWGVYYLGLVGRKGYGDSGRLVQ